MSAKFEPTSDQRHRVSVAAGGGMRSEDIALALGISIKELDAHFGIELARGASERRMEVLQAMYDAAMGGSVQAQNRYLSFCPEVIAPPWQSRPPGGKPEPKPEPPPKVAKLGKKDQANVDATTVQEGTGWADLLPTKGQIQ